MYGFNLGDINYSLTKSVVIWMILGGASSVPIWLGACPPWADDDTVNQNTNIHIQLHKYTWKYRPHMTAIL